MNSLLNQSTKVILGALFFIGSATAHSKSTEKWFDAARSGDRAVLERVYSEQKAILDLQDTKGYTALILASYHNHKAAVELLLAKGADACLPDNKGNTALMGAIFKGHTPMIEILIRKCDVNHRNNDGQTALMYASLFGRENVAKKLLELGADPNLSDHDGRTALTLAEGQWNQAMVKFLKTFKIIN